MRKLDEVIINGKPLSIILENHLHWLNADCEGWENMKADLTEANLSNIDFSGTDLRHINFFKATIDTSYFNRADIRFANFKETDLNFDCFNEANLYGADFSEARLYRIEFAGANLCKADFYGAYLDAGQFCKSKIYDTNFNNCNFSHSTLLEDANGKLTEYRRGKMLTEDIIGYKKCQDNVIVTLKIPRGAIVFSINGTKCRTNKAKVIAIDGAKKAISSFKHMSYYVGDEFTIYDFDCTYNNQCGEGIHFFLTREEAEGYIVN